jgi:transcriptional regulator with XRE-family HTH domain
MNFLDNQVIGARLKQYREEVLKINCFHFAQNTEIDNSYYAKVENGKKAITEKMLIKILLKYKDLSRDYILFGEKAERPQFSEAPVSLPDNEITRIKNSVILADSILKILPRVKTSHDSGLKEKIYLEREEKYEMVIKILRASVATLLDARKKHPKQNK